MKLKIETADKTQSPTASAVIQRHEQEYPKFWQWHHSGSEMLRNAADELEKQFGSHNAQTEER